jgi:cytidine deaminase
VREKERDVSDEALIQAADAVRQHAHAPYSGLRVGAAVEDTAGRVYVGANVENASFGLTLCAERAALAAAVADGALARGIQRVAVVTAEGYTPCGACRQVLLELAPGAMVIVARPDGTSRRFTPNQLLPEAFETFRPDVP